MRSLFHALALAGPLLASVPLPAGHAGEGPTAGAPAWIEVRTGRVRVAREGGVHEILAGESRCFPGRTHLAVDAVSEVTVRWPAQASLRLQGPATLEWGASAPGQPPRVVVYHCGPTHADVRTGAGLVLPGVAVADLSSGLYFLRSLPGGTWRLEHDAGLPSRLHRARDGAGAFEVLRQGTRVVLGPARRTPGVAGSDRRAPAALSARGRPLPGSWPQATGPLPRPEFDEAPSGAGSGARPVPEVQGPVPPGPDDDFEARRRKALELYRRTQETARGMAGEFSAEPSRPR